MSGAIHAMQGDCHKKAEAVGRITCCWVNSYLAFKTQFSSSKLSLASPTLGNCTGLVVL